METQPSKELPKDYLTYPGAYPFFYFSQILSISIWMTTGKMDHTTLAIFVVGTVSVQNVERVWDQEREEREKEAEKNIKVMN